MKTETKAPPLVAKEIRERTLEAIAARRPPQLPDPQEWRSLRTRAGLTVTEVAEILQVTKSAVTHWEHGSRRPSRRVAASYAVLLQTLREAS